MMKAEQVTKWFIKKNPYLSSGYIDENTILNKLLYFANLFSYAVTNEKMISDKFVAFPNGPVVYDVYRDYRYNNLSSIPEEEIMVDSKYKKILDIVNFIYANKCKTELVNISHSHNLWRDVKERIPNNPEIIFENAEPELLNKCKSIFNAYADVDLNKIKVEVVNGNVYYYNIDDIQELTDAMIEELMQQPKSDEGRFIELWDGELVIS